MKQTSIFLLLVILLSCGKNSADTDKNPVIINFDNQLSFDAYKKLNLDSIYPNLLDSINSTQEQHKKVIESWSEFHQQVSKFMKDENFTWDSPDSTISIVNKIYFSKRGSINYYVLKIINPSISISKKLEFETVLKNFSKSITMSLNRDSKYAQCGKTRYLNY